MKYFVIGDEFTGLEGPMPSTLIYTLIKYLVMDTVSMVFLENTSGKHHGISTVLLQVLLEKPLVLCR